jgi:hypothetical protein
MGKENKWQKDIFIYTFAIQHLSISDILKEFAILFPQQITQVLQHVVCYLMISVLHDERMKVEIYFESPLSCLWYADYIFVSWWSNRTRNKTIRQWSNPVLRRSKGTMGFWWILSLSHTTEVWVMVRNNAKKVDMWFPLS